jgi:hypothetical protein
VVLGLRTSADAWLDSVNRPIAKVFGKGPIYYMTYFAPPMRFGFQMNNPWDAQTQEKYQVGVRTTDCYQLHNDHVREVVSKDRLLEFKAADGWEPLCEFLGKDVPEGRFPHKNDSKGANPSTLSFVIYGVGVWMGIAVCGGG